MSVRGVYAAGNCDPSLDGVVSQVSEPQPRAVISPLFPDRKLRGEPSNYLHLKIKCSPAIACFKKKKNSSHSG